MKKRNPRARIAVALGTAANSQGYCSKGEQSHEEWELEHTKGKNWGKNADFFESGTLPQQGKRTDLATIATQILAGTATAESILIDQPTMYHQYGRTLEKLEDIKQRKKYRKERTSCIWYYGATGVGKSHTAFLNYSPETHYVYKNSDKGWWDGYKQQDIVIINEFRGAITYSFLLELIDEFPTDVPRRGREPMPFVSKQIIITSSLHPADVYHNLSLDDKLEQLYDRIKLVHLKGENKRHLPVEIDPDVEKAVTTASEFQKYFL